MNKTVTSLVFALFLICKIHAQNAQNIEIVFNNTSENFVLNTLSLRSTGTQGIGSLITKEYPISLKNPEPFIAFSLALEGNNMDVEEIEMSLLTQQKGEWAKVWQPVEHNHDADNSPSRMVSNMIELDKHTTAFKLRLNIKAPHIELKKAKIRLFAAGNISTGSYSPTLEARGICTIPPSVSRAVWGAQWGLADDKIYKGSPSYSAVTHLIVHHSASNNTSTNWAAVVASYFDTHVNTNGWSDLGYNWLIAPDGTLFVGRGGGNNVIGAHMCGYNTNTMGVCLIGDFTSVEPTQKALDKLQQLLAWKASESGIEPLSFSDIRSHSGTMNNISGHKDGCAPAYTECPGNKLYPKLPTVRQNVKNIIASCVTSNDEVLNIDNLKISPNPNKGVFQVSMKLPSIESHNWAIQVFNPLGQRVYSQSLPSQISEIQENIQLPNTSHSFYLIQISNGNQSILKKIQCSF